jgi:hypothetical protein
MKLYDRFSFPDALRWTLGVVELFAATLLLIPQTATLGALILMPIALGATYVFLFNDMPAVALIPACLFLMLVFAAWERSRTRQLVMGSLTTTRH